MVRAFVSFCVLLCLSASGLASDDPMDRPVAARFDERISVGRAYEVLGDLSGIRFVFDEGVRLDEMIELDTSGLTLRQVLEVQDLVTGTQRTPMSDGVVLVYPDNQTKRREYEAQAVRTFYLQHARVRDVNALLRGIIDVRKTAVNEAARAITIRDTADKVELAGRVIAHHDVERTQVDIQVELWLVGPKRAGEIHAAGPAWEPGRADEIRRRAGVEVIASSHLPAIDGDPVQLTLHEVGGLFFELGIEPRVHPDDRTLTLEWNSIVSVGTSESQAGGRHRRAEAAARVGNGGSVVVSSTLVFDRSSGESLSVLGAGRSPEDTRSLVVLLTPRVARWPAIPAEFEQGMLIGTEKRLRAPSR
jgi:hypothetical protein